MLVLLTQGLYIPLSEFVHWAQTHPEYSKQQVCSLVECSADMQGLRKKAKADLIAQVEAHLSMA